MDNMHHILNLTELVAYELNYNYHVVTRGLSNFKKNAFRLDVARNHFCNRVVSLWNGLPEYVVTAASLTMFRKY